MAIAAGFAARHAADTPTGDALFPYLSVDADTPINPASHPVDPVVLVMLEGAKEIERLRAALMSILFAAEAGRYPGENLRKFARQVARVALRVDEDPWLDDALDTLRANVEAARHELAALPLDVSAPLGLESAPAPAPLVSSLEQPEQGQQPVAGKEHAKPKRGHSRLDPPGRKR